MDDIKESNVEEFYNSLVEKRFLSLGEVIDKIEYGMTAYSLSGEDKGICYEVDEDGKIYSLREDDIPDENDMVSVNYVFTLRKSKDQETKEKRFLLIYNDNKL
jgi:hypothetical protein